MANLNFPANPTIGQVHTAGNKSWEWNGVAWAIQRVSQAGKSAYDIAIENGFVGTEAQWISSLKGDKGERGSQGTKGDTGLQGPKGDTGDRGADGTNGTNGTNGQGVPSGGSVGQVLTKNSNDPFDTSWKTPDYLSDYTVPLGGNQGQYLGKRSAADGDFGWLNLPAGDGGTPELPQGGNEGQVLTKNSAATGDVKWANPTGGSGVPDGGTTGQVLTKNSNLNGDATWQTITGGTGDVEEAPLDGKQYARKDGTWVEVISGGGLGGVAFEPIDATGTSVTQAIDLPTGVTEDFEIEVYVNGLHLGVDEYAVTNGKLYIQTNAVGDKIEVRSAIGGQITSGSGDNFPEAPLDGKPYARQNGDWVEITQSTGGSGEADPYYRMAGFFTTSPAVNEILMIYVVDVPITLPANFSGSQVKLIGMQPQATFTLSIRKNSTTEIGTLTVNTDGSTAYATSGGTAKTLAAGDAISIHAPGVSDVVSNLTWILRGNK